MWPRKVVVVCPNICTYIYIYTHTYNAIPYTKIWHIWIIGFIISFTCLSSIQYTAVSVDEIHFPRDYLHETVMQGGRERERETACTLTATSVGVTTHWFGRFWSNINRLACYPQGMDVTRADDIYTWTFHAHSVRRWDIGLEGFQFATWCGTLYVYSKGIEIDYLHVFI